MSKSVVKQALFITIPYLLLGSIYIAFSDKLVHSLYLNEEMITQIQTYKGWGFIVLTAVLLFILLYRYIKNLELEKTNLKASEEKWRSLVTNSPDYIALLDKERKFLFVNKYPDGFTSKQVIGADSIEYFSDEYKEQFKEIFQKCFDTKTTQKFEVEAFGDNHSIRHYEEFIVPLLSDTNEINFLVIARDITDRKTFEAKLKESEERWRSLVSSSPDFIALLDKESRFLYLNKYADGFNEEIVIGQNCADFMDIKFRSKYLEIFKTCLENKTIQKFEFEAYGNNKSTRYYEEYLVPLLSKDDEITFLAIARDISDRKKSEIALKESEEKYRTLIENTQEAIYIAQDGKIKFVNKSAKDITGRSESELIDKDLTEFVPEEDREFTHEHHRQLISGEISESQTEFRLIHSDGRIIDLLVNSVLIQWNDKPATLNFASNITERKKVEEELLLAHTRIRQFIDSNIVGVIIANSEGAIIEANDYYLDMIGYTRQELEDGKVDWKKLTPPEWFFTDEIALKELEEKGTCTPYEKEYVKRDGTRVSVYLVDALLPGEDKQIAAFALDITDRKRFESELIASEEKYRSLFENMNEGLAYCKMIFENEKPVDFIYLNTNPKFKELTGLKNVEGKKVSEIIPGIQKDNPELFEIYGRVSLGGKSELFETFVPGLNEWFSVSVYSPNKAHFVAIFATITERKLAEKALVESEERFRNIVEGAPDAIFIRTEDKLVYLNPAACSLFGIDSPDELVGTPVFNLIHPDYRKITLERMKKIDTERKIIDEQYELRFLGKNGREGWVETKGEPIIYNGKKSTLVFLRDITARKKAEEALRLSEERFRTTLDNMLEGCQILDSDLNYVYINDAAEKQNHRPKSELLRNNYLEMWPGIENTYVYRVIKDCAQNKITHQFENEFVYPDGSIGWFDLSIQPIPEGVFILSIDITDRKKVEQDILESREQLRIFAASLERVREEERIALSRELHDHLGQNLTGLKMDVAYLAKHFSSKYSGDKKNFIQKTMGMSDLIDDLIKNVRKISSELRPNVLDYLGLIPAIEWHVEEFRKRTGINCSYSSNILKIDLGMQINSSIFRIIQEAFTNIIRHSKATSVDLIIDEQFDNISIKIIDNGIGINLSELSNLKTLGILGMRERTVNFNGKLHIENVNTGGTMLTLNIPKEIKND